MTDGEIDDRLPVRDPERDVVEGQGLHAGTIPRAVRPASQSPVTYQRLRLVERELADFLRAGVVERFAAVFLPPRDAAAFDDARFEAAAFLPPRDAAAFDGARFEAAAFLPPRDAAAFDGARFAELDFLRAVVVFFAPAAVRFFAPAAVVFFAPAVDVFLRAAVAVFFFAPAVEVFLRAAVAVFFFFAPEAVFFFAAADVFFFAALDFVRELAAPVFEREAARAALVELDPADTSASPVSAHGWLTTGTVNSSAR
jgi:hypothetical protein